MDAGGQPLRFVDFETGCPSTSHEICVTLRRYEIFTISKPATPLARLTYPLVRFHQRHFARQSLRRMITAVSEGAVTY